MLLPAPATFADHAVQAGCAPAVAADTLLETTQSLCPLCGRLVAAELVARAGRVIMRKTCPQHGPCEALVFGDAELFARLAPYDRPGRPPLQFSAQVERGCPHDCGLCPDHRQHLCLGIIEVNSVCNLACPLCLANAGPHPAHPFALTRAQVAFMLDHFVACEGHPEVIQFSGGEPTLHPEILDFIAMAQERGIGYVMLNTNGLRIAHDDRFLAGLARLKPHVYLQFDGLAPATTLALRGRADLAQHKLRALDRLAEAGLRAILVPVIERGVNEHEIGPIVEFGLRHPAVFGVSFQSAFHAQRCPPFDPLQRVTAPDILHALEAQTAGLFRSSDFVPVPCCAPRCAFTTYAILNGPHVLPIPRMLAVDQYLNYLENRSIPALDQGLLALLEQLWSAAAQAGSDQTAQALFAALAGSPAETGPASWTVERCAACRVGLPIDAHLVRDLARHIFMITLRDFMDPWTFDTRAAHKCCIGVLVPDGRTIPFCAYNSAGYREQLARRPAS